MLTGPSDAVRFTVGIDLSVPIFIGIRPESVIKKYKTI
jgi:hypothetical protein